MKKTLIIVTCILLSASISAQDFKKFSFGMRISPNVSWLKPDVENEVYKSEGAGIHFGYGADFNYFFIENIGIGTGINYVYSGGKLKYHSSQDVIISDTTRTLQGILNRKYKLQYLEIPLVLIGSTGDILGKFAIYGKFGLGIGFNTRARADDDFTPDNATVTYTTKDKNVGSSVSFFRESLIVGVGLTYQLGKTAALNAGFTYNSNFTNILTATNAANPEIKEKAKLHFVQMDIGIIF